MNSLVLCEMPSLASVTNVSVVRSVYVLTTHCTQFVPSYSLVIMMRHQNTSRYITNIDTIELTACTA